METITSPYVDYEYYQNEYGGICIKTEKDFKRAEKFAEAFVNQVTFGRILKLSELTASIKDAICSVADSVSLQWSKKENSVKSESNDGYSVSYVDATSDTALRKEMHETVNTYLANTGLLYRGVVEKYDNKQ